MTTLSVSNARSPIRRMLASLRPVRVELAGAVLLGALATICAIGLLAVSGWLISRASQMPPVLTLEVAIVSVRAFGIGRGFFRYGERIVSHDAVFRALTTMRVTVWRRLEKLAPQGLSGFRRGDLLARMVADVDAVQDLALRIVLPVGVALLSGGLSVVVTWWLLPTAGLVLLLALVCGATVVPWLTTTTGALAESQTAQARGDLSAQVGELLRGAPDLLACDAASTALAETDATDRELTGLSQRIAWTTGLGSGLGVLLAGVAVLGALVAAIPAVADGRLAGVSLAVVVLLPLAAYESFVGLPPAALAVARVRASAGRLVDVLDAPDLMSEPTSPVQIVDQTADVQLRGVTAAWGLGQPDVLHGIDLDLAAGRRIAVVGTSGAGKSTLASVLVRFVEYGGSATLGGVELRELAADVVRSSVVICAEDSHVFDNTVAANLRIGRTDASEAELLAVSARVGLTDFIASLPLGLDTPVGEHGGRLSGGQRRRLVVARALLADPEVLILDEPTAQLDEDTAAGLLADLLELTRGRTTLIISHRLIGLENVDEIVVLSGGLVIERGRHDALVAANGVYAERWQQEQEHVLTLRQAGVLGE